MPHRGNHVELLAQIFLDGFDLGGGLHHD
jgi:hypothetical protein